jgi:RNA polymerase sigma-70 factor (TIGR02943 family)
MREKLMTSGSDRLENDKDYLVGLRRDMLRFTRLQLRDEHLAEDVVQEALAAALTGKREFEGRSALKTWVFGILRNKIVDAIRVRSRTVNVGALADEEAGLDEAFESLFKPNAHWHPEARPRDWGDPEAALRQDQFWVVFEACLDHLPANTARVFMMREFLEFDTEEVCAELSLSSGNCHVILHRARNALRRCLEKSWFAGEGAPSC